MGVDRRYLLGRQIRRAAFAHRMADAAGLLDQRLLWPLATEDAPKVCGDVASEVRPLKRIRVGMIQRQVSKCVADVVCVEKVSMAHPKSKDGTDRSGQTHCPRYTAGCTGLSCTRPPGSPRSS